MVTNNIATAIPVRDTADAVTHGAREGNPSATPLADLASSFQNVLHKSLRIDATGMKEAMSLAHSPARDPAAPPEPPEFDSSSRRPDDRDDAPASDADPPDDRGEWEANDRARDSEWMDSTETRSDMNRSGGDGNPRGNDAEGVSGLDDARASDVPRADAGGDPARAATTAKPSTGAAQNTGETADPIASRATGRETASSPANPAQRGEANSAPASAGDNGDFAMKAGAAARQANELAKSLPAGEDLKINVAVSKPGDTLFSQPASSLAATTVADGQKTASRPGQTPVGASAKAGFVAALNPGQGPATAQPDIQVNGGSSAGDTQPRTGAQGNQVNLAAAQSRGGGTPAPTSAGTFADVTGIGSSGTPQAGQRAGPGQVPVAGKPASSQPPATEQISVQISKAAKAGIDRIDIHLRPKSLGRVEVRLELAADGRVSATITVENRETLELLKSDARGLEKALDDAGLKADSNSLNFNLKGQDGRPSGNQLSQTNHPDASHGGGEGELADDSPARTLGDYSSGGLSADGRIDIEI